MLEVSLKKAEIHDKFDLCETLLRLGGSQDCEGGSKLYGVECNLFGTTRNISVVFARFLKANLNSQVFMKK